jgi:hypothetical protein
MRANDIEKCPESRDTMSKAGFEKRAGTNAPCTSDDGLTLSLNEGPD